MKHKAWSFGLGAWCAMALSSCMYAGGNAQTGEWRIAAVGTDIKKHDISAQGWQADDVNNSTATRDIAGGVVKGARNAAILGLAGKGVDAVQSVGNNVINKTLQ